ncbi:MAG: holo-ACP synthase [Clostridia bacterium]|jgi:holo-[acyl-carrier protein] synthase|nr:holo-ACP synthase [Clostridia bacterium]
MNIYCGTDIIEIKRIEKAIETKEEKFLKKIFTDKEIEYCEKKEQKYEHYAARFAAKEAIFKAISLKTKEPIKWKMIEITNTKGGKPIVNFLEKIEKLQAIDVSISHCKDYAIANAIAIFE